MGELVDSEPKEPMQIRPAWSVLVGEFDLQNPILNSILVARMADKFPDAPRGSDWRHLEQAKELVRRAYELCGIDRSVVEDKITNDRLVIIKDWSKQVKLAELTPELDTHPNKEGSDELPETTSSPVMDALRALIELSNGVERITTDERVRTDKDRWLVDRDTARLAEATLRSLCLEEKSLSPADTVE